MFNSLRETIEQLTAPGQMFEISNVELDGYPARTWTHAPATLRQLWSNTLGHADKDYLVYRDERWTYAQAHQAVERIANWLSTHGVKQHDRVAIAMRNYPEWLLSYWAVTSMGAVVVGINAWWVAEELDYALSDSQPVVILCDQERLERFASIRDRHPGMIAVALRCQDAPEWAVPWPAVLQADPAMPAVDIDPEDDACIFYTSGTTGSPKGAQLTHRGCCNNVLSMLFVNLTQGRLSADLLNMPAMDPTRPDAPSPATLLATPLFHVTANNCSAQPTTVAGGKLAFMYKWDPEEALRIIDREKISTLASVPAMARELMLHPRFGDYDTSSMRGFGGGGAPVQPDLVAKIGARGSAAVQGYGMTETCGIIAASIGAFLAEKPTSCGPPLPIFEVKITDAEGQPLVAGEVGQVCVRGAQVVKGYLNRPEATAQTIIDGWLQTGDIGYLDDDNFLHLVDRAKDMVLRGGENIYCSEVENVLFRHNAVQEVAVFSVPDERLGEEVGAAVYLRPGQTLQPDTLRSFAAEHLATFKLPRYIWILDTPLPRNANGKFLKKTLSTSLLVADAR